jgi:hypothetical protein
MFFTFLSFFVMYINMGALLTLCASDEPSKEELKRELETKKTEIIWINMRLKEINAALRQHQDKCRNLAATAERCAAYDSLIKSKVATAKQIMSSKLHLTYMDDSVEEKYIIDLLQWIEKNVSETNETSSDDEYCERTELKRGDTLAQLDKMMAILEK